VLDSDEHLEAERPTTGERAHNHTYRSAATQSSSVSLGAPRPAWTTTSRRWPRRPRRPHRNGLGSPLCGLLGTRDVPATYPRGGASPIDHNGQTARWRGLGARAAKSSPAFATPLGEGRARRR